ncbi:uncharacterized protein P884DRAFT_304899, partial [Thermothelomyces heterothallicus CBS 202.75]|uniref:uncharacterized protein n=1 Tax=Thermothelomyces heterothallicus CBS 202.75 TaxID=1149848 RepID=UPI0037425372
ACDSAIFDEGVSAQNTEWATENWPCIVVSGANSGSRIRDGHPTGVPRNFSASTLHPVGDGYLQILPSPSFTSTACPRLSVTAPLSRILATATQPHPPPLTVPDESADYHPPLNQPVTGSPSVPLIPSTAQRNLEPVLSDPPPCCAALAPSVLSSAAALQPFSAALLCSPLPAPSPIPATLCLGAAAAPGQPRSAP